MLQQDFFALTDDFIDVIHYLILLNYVSVESEEDSKTWYHVCPAPSISLLLLKFQHKKK